MIRHQFLPYMGLWKVPFIFSKANLLSSNLNHFSISSVLWVHIETVDLKEDVFPTGDNLSMKHPLMRSASVAMCVTTVTVFLSIFEADSTGCCHRRLIQHALAFRIGDFSFGAKSMQEKIQKTLRSSRTIVCTADLAYGCSVGLLCATAGSFPNLPPLNSRKG